MNSAFITNIQGYSIHDGPGIRTVVFLKGCPLRCVWCTAPDSQSVFPEMKYFADKCIRCAKCAEVCPLKVITIADSGEILTDIKSCDNCGKCAEVCPAQALPYGERRTEPNNISNSAGELKWRVNAEECAKYWVNGHMGCNTCVACCPFNKMEDSLNYTGHLKPDNFWDEWNPIPYGASGIQSWTR